MKKTIKIKLSTKDLDYLIKELNNLLPQHDEKKLLEDLAIIGEKKANENLYSIPDTDGNELGKIEVNYENNSLKISHVGGQVKFLEFGTGKIGKANPHPEASKHYYEYDIKRNPKFHTDRGTWIYKDKRLNVKVETPGIPANKHMYKTAQYLRKYLIEKGLKVK